MRLDEAKEILKDNGFLCEKIEADLNNIKAGDEFLIYTLGDYGDYPRYKATAIEPDDNVKPSLKGKVWKYKLTEIKHGPSEYYIGKKHSFTHGTYGDAIVYPVVRYKSTFVLGDKTSTDSICFLGEEVRFGRNEFRKSKWDDYFVTDMDKLTNGDINWGSSDNVITDERKIDEIFAEHPELEKEYNEIERKYYNLHK